ncbi:MAG: glycosyltransferase family 4 protein [Bacteroidetes bacterium]|jgi:glycosyltransferase involved in cell wall biosynthesis|nr:glycosyltransferase family 4 protein [Bacteroidota bacterium]
MKVLYISYDGMTDPLGQSQVMPYLCGLALKGYEITILSCEKKERFKKHNEYIAKALNTASVNWIPVPYSTLPSFLSKQLNLFRLQKKAYEFCKKNNPFIVHCRSYMAALIGLKIKNKFGSKFIFDMRGFWADERIDGRIWDLNNFIQKRLYSFFKKKELEFLQKADMTISLTKHAKDEIHSWPSINKSSVKIEVIPCCADFDLFSRQNIQISDVNKIREKLNISKNDFVVTYLGSVGTWYMLDEMIDFFKELIQRRTSAKFLFITLDDSELIYQKAISKNILPQSIIICPAMRNEVPLLLSLSSVSLYFIKPFYSKMASSPTKTAEIMGLGIPIITNTGIGDSDDILIESKGGLLIKDFSAEEYNLAIDNLDQLIFADKQQIINTAYKYFSLNKGIDHYANVYQNLKNK